jgi:hemin uptake protein HemP
MDTTQEESTSKPEEPTSAIEPELVIASQNLLQGRREIYIDHEGQKYRLRVTSRGKLYLTK